MIGLNAHSERPNRCKPRIYRILHNCLIFNHPNPSNPSCAQVRVLKSIQPTKPKGETMAIRSKSTVKALSKANYKAIEDLYFKGLSISEIHRELGIPRSSVVQALYTEPVRSKSSNAPTLGRYFN